MYIGEFVHSFMDVLWKEIRGDVLKIKFKLLVKRRKLLTTHLNKTGQCKRPPGRESQDQPMRVERWKGLVRPFQSQEL